MRTCLATTVSGGVYETLAQLNLPYMKRFAEKVGADLNVLYRKRTEDWRRSVMVKMELGHIVSSYDRTLVLDIDMVVSPDMPNVFDWDTPFLAPMYPAPDDNKWRQGLARTSNAIGVPVPKLMLNSSFMLCTPEYSRIFDSSQVTEPMIEDNILVEQDMFNINLNQSGLPFDNLYGRNGGELCQVEDPYKPFHIFHAVRQRDWENKIGLCERAIFNMRNSK